MISLISGTNRRDSKTLVFTKHYQKVVEAKGQKTSLLALDQLPASYFHSDMYNPEKQSAEAQAIQDKYVIPAEKFIIISPEYNGSIPGVLKMFVDACSVRNAKASFPGKKVLLVGVAAGRAGNLRGMEHMTGFLNHLGMIVYPNRLPFSQIGNILDESGTSIINESSINLIEKHVDDFINF